MFGVLPCLGVFRDSKASRFGFIFQPPSYIEQIPSSSSDEGSVSGPRMPKTLHDLLLQASNDDGLRPNIFPLGDRFRLACSLAQSLYAMHAIGWVHKKYEPSTFGSCKVTHGAVYGLSLSYFYPPNPRVENSLPPVVRWIPQILTCADLVTRGQNVSSMTVVG